MLTELCLDYYSRKGVVVIVSHLLTRTLYRVGGRGGTEPQFFLTVSFEVFERRSRNQSNAITQIGGQLVWALCKESVVDASARFGQVTAQGVQSFFSSVTITRVTFLISPPWRQSFVSSMVDGCSSFRGLRLRAMLVRVTSPRRSLGRGSSFVISLWGCRRLDWASILGFSCRSRSGFSLLLLVADT